MATSKLNSWADIATQGHYKEQRRKIEQMMQNNAPDVEVTEKCAESIVKPYTTGTEKSKSHGLMVTLGKCGKGKSSQPASDSQETTNYNQESALLKPAKLGDFIGKTVDDLPENSAPSANHNEYDNAVEKMLNYVQKSHNTNSLSLYGETQEIELDLNKEFPALGNSDDSDRIVLGSRTFYQMKRSAEKTKPSEESHKKVLRLEDGSLFFGDDTNISTYDPINNDDADVVDDYEVETQISRSRTSSVVCDGSEWEVDTNVHFDHRSSISDIKTTPTWMKEISDEATSNTTDTNCDDKEEKDTNRTTIDDIISDSEESNEDPIKTKGPIWGIDSSLVKAPTCVFDVTVLPEQWLTTELQGWSKMKCISQSDTKQLPAQTPTSPTSNEEQSDIEINGNTKKAQESSDNAETPCFQNEKHESGVESNNEVTSDNDHCEQAPKSFTKNHRHTVGSTDDSNRSSPPSESNASSGSESDSGPPSITDLIYDTDDVAKGGTWGSRCPSPEPEDGALSFGLPSPTDVWADFTFKNDVKAELYNDSKSTVKSDHDDMSIGLPSWTDNWADFTFQDDVKAKLYKDNTSNVKSAQDNVSTGLPSSIDVWTEFTFNNDVREELHNGNKSNKQSAQDNMESETSQATLEKQSCDKAEEENKENVKAFASESENKERDPEQLSGSKDIVDNDKFREENESSPTSEKKITENEFSKVEAKVSEKPRNTSPNSSRDHSLEGKEVRQIFTPKKNDDSSSSPSREPSPCKQKQSKAQQNTIDIEKITDINNSVDVSSKGSLSPKLTRHVVRKKRRAPVPKRKPELFEKKAEVTVRRLEVEEKKTEPVNTPLSTPSMTLKDLTRLPLSDIIAIKKCLEPKKHDVDLVSQVVYDPSPKLLMPKKRTCDKPISDTSPQRIDEYSNWDNREWNPFEDSGQNEAAPLILPRKQLASDFPTNTNAVNGTDGQSDTDSGHWTAAQEERSSLRSSPRTTPYTPTTDADRISLQSEESVDREVNYSPFGPIGFKTGPHAQSTSLPTNIMQGGNSQQPPNQFTPAMSSAGPGQNMQAPWFNMAMQCWAQQYMAQMQLMATQMQQGNSFNPWMMPNQSSNSNPLSPFQGPPGIMNQIPNSQPSGMGGQMNSHYAGTDQRIRDSMNQMQSGISQMNYRQSSPTPVSGPYYGPPEQNVNSSSASVSNGMRSSAVIAQPGTLITVTRPGRETQSYGRSPKPTSINEKAQSKVKTRVSPPVVSNDLVPPNIQKKSASQEKRKQVSAVKEIQKVTAASPKRCDVIKIGSLMVDDEELDNVALKAENDAPEDKGDEYGEEDYEDADSDNEVESEEEEEDDQNNDKDDKTKNKAQDSEGEKKSQVRAETRSRTFKSARKTKRNTSPKEKIRFKGLRKFCKNHRGQMAVVFQVLLMFGLAIILYQILDEWKASTFR